MSILQRTPVNVLFGASEQKAGAKLAGVTIPGSLVAAENVQQLETGVYSKRYGYSPENRTTDTGSITTAKVLVSANAGLHLQTTDTVFVRNTGQSKWLNRGDIQRVSPSNRMALTQAGHKPYLIADSVSGNTWVVAASDNGGLKIRAFNTTTGATILTEQQLVSVGDTYWMPKIVVCAGFTYVFWMYWSTAAVSNIFCAKYNASTGAVVTGATSFYSNTGHRSYDVMTAGGQVYIVVAGQALTVTSGGTDVFVARLNQTTLVPDGLGRAGYTIGGTGGGAPLCWAKGSAGTTGHYAVLHNGTTNYSLNSVLLSTLAPTNVTVSSGGVSQLACYYNASAVATVITADVSWTTTLACEPFVVNGVVHILYQDPTLIQEAYYLQTGGGSYETRTLYSRGADRYMQAGVTTTTAANAGATAMLRAGLSPASVIGNKAYIALSGIDVGTHYVTYATAFDCAPSCSVPLVIANGDAVLLPASFAHIVSAGGTVQRLQPGFPETTVSSTTGAAAVFTNGIYSFLAVYVHVGTDGTRYESAPSVVKTITVNNIGAPYTTTMTISVPVIPVIPQTSSTVTTEFYATTGGGSTYYLIGSTESATGSATLTANTVAAMEVYTTGGIVENAPLPPWRLGCIFNNRAILSGTDFPGDVWISKEMLTPGVGPGFNEDLVINVGEGQGESNALGVVDRSYFAAIKKDAIYAIGGGPGPDDRGNGQYDVTKLDTTLGSTNPNVVSCPLGLVFQGIDGGIYLIGVGALAITEIGQGIDDYKTAVVTSAVHVPSAKHVRLYTDTSKILVWDYGHVGREPQWYVWNNQGGVAATVHGAQAHHVDSTGVVWKEVAGQWFDNVSTAILPKLTLNTLSFGQLTGYCRVYRGVFLGGFNGAHTIRVTCNGVAFADKAISAAPEVLYFHPAPNKVMSLDVTIEEVATANLTAGFDLIGLGFEVGVLPGVSKTKTTTRL